MDGGDEQKTPSSQKANDDKPEVKEEVGEIAETSNNDLPQFQSIDSIFLQEHDQLEEIVN